MAGKIHSIRIEPLERCSECGNLKGFDLGYVRRVDEMYLVPRKSRTYSVDSNLKPYCIEDLNAEWNRKFPDNPIPETESPEGLYPGVIVPKVHVGHLLRVIPISEEQDRDESDRKRRQDDERRREK